MKALYITGFMGSGKTTVGKALGARLSLPVIDTDEQVEQKRGCSIREIFAKQGESAFRELETMVLKELPTNDVIITTGGGIVGKEENRNWMKRHGTVFYLYCDPHAIIERIKEDTARPLFQSDDIPGFLELFRSRQGWYEQAHYKVDTTDKNINDIVKEIEAVIKQS
ncbi:MAG: shikimate kinase [Ectobacillus sp.]